MQSYWFEFKPDAYSPIIKKRTIKRPEVRKDEVLVQVKAAALNRGELMPGYLTEEPTTIVPAGSEVAGKVVEIGHKTSPLKIGDAVMGRCRGAFSDYALLNANDAILIPKGLDWTTAAAIPLTFLVAYDSLFIQSDLMPDDFVLILGASSGVGVACLQLANLFGAKTIGTSGSKEKLSVLKKLGLTHAIQTRRADFLDKVMGITEGKGANIIINTVGGSIFTSGVASLAYKGHLATIGYVDNVFSAEIDLKKLHSHRLVIFGVSNKYRTASERQLLIQSFSEKILPFFAKGKIKPHIDKVFPFTQLFQAVKHMEKNSHVGKIILEVG